MDSNKLQKKLWSDDRYYQKISQTDDLSHPGILAIKKALKNCQTILDVGAGDGRKIKLLGKKKAIRFGTEVSPSQLVNNPNYLGSVAFGENLPFQTEIFDAVTSFFVIEHVVDPQACLNEMIRVVKPGGLICILAPNYGAPNRASPNFVGSRLKKLVFGWLADFGQINQINWNQVIPKSQSMENFESDWDTTVEPYLGSLEKFMNFHGVKTLATNSYWSMEKSGAGKLQRFFKVLSYLKIFPFKYWGPHLLFIGKKEL